ncbi:hypothetical protein [Psychrobacillus sp. INOP01]|nr:hypothetical protein [Psychrobacillus sp. INOP01]
MNRRKLSEEVPRKKKWVKEYNKNGILIGAPRPPRPQITSEDVR